MIAHDDITTTPQRSDDDTWALVESIRPWIGKKSREMAARYPGVGADDLEQIGLHRAWQCASGYNASHASGASFLTYASYSIVRDMHKHGWAFVMPVYQYFRPDRPLLYRVALDDAFGDDGDESQANRRLDCAFTEDKGARLDAETMGRLTHHALTRLKPRHRRVMSGIFMGETLTAIAAELGVTHQYVCQLRDAAIASLRANPALKKLHTELHAQ